ncbi:flagellar basal-body MS-ring/collar protein FliF [Blastomonas aquatica]|uniref:Flagellar M-ring protein n=1 Tax=Blastomonas aquatica TaxID=1510276 RepID=A0ABQ1ITZ0_9SPHN|nr:flagellar basal-body MS-ring/collar protein FliF [Blastomonas aquatica]GGB52375.1 flagellar M-ring protein [Blastomonas aquatica]
MSEITITPNSSDGAALAPSPIIMGGSGAAGRVLGGTAIPEQVRNFVAQPAVAKAMPLLGFMGVVMLAIMAWAALREPPQRDLFRGLPDSDKAAVISALDGSTIPYSFEERSGTIMVSEDDYHQAKIALAAQGLPKSAPSGDELISSMPMGASRAVENEKLRAARELDLARSIEAMDSVVSARVHLAVEPPSIFIRDRNEPAASVVLQLADAGRLPESQVQAIVHLVASSVPGLSAENVSLVDQNGRLLSSNSKSSSMDEAERQIEVKETIEERYRRQLTALLTPMLGAGNFVAEVSTEVNFAERQATTESFPADEARVRSEQTVTSTEAQPAPAGGVPGALANQPPADPNMAIEPGAELAGAEGAAPGQTTTRNEQVNRNFELGREVAVTREPSGKVTRISVAVAVKNLAGGKERSAAEIAAIEALVKGAIGFDVARGDQVAISSRNFEPVTELEVPFYETSWFNMLVRNVSALLVALALIFGIGRPLLKRYTKQKADDKETAALTAADEGPGALLAQALARDGSDPRAIGRTASDNEPVTLDMINAASSYQERALLIQNFVRQNPDHATLVVRDLLKGSADAAKEPVDA